MEVEDEPIDLKEIKLQHKHSDEPIDNSFFSNNIQSSKSPLKRSHQRPRNLNVVQRNLNYQRTPDLEQGEDDFKYWINSKNKNTDSH